VVAGNVSALVIEDRRTGEARSYYELERADGSIVPLTGPAAATLQDGARVMASGTHNGDQFAVQSIQQLSPPSPSLMAAKAANATQVEGTLAIAHADDFATGKSKYFYHLHDDAGAITDLSVASLPAELRGGMRVIVSGQRSADGSSLRPQRITILSAPGPGSSTAQDLVAKAVTTNTVLVILANFNNTAAPAFTSAQAQQVMSSNSNSVANYYSEVSYGQQALNVTVTSSWVTMNLAATCSYTSISSAANAAALAANPAYNASNYNFVVYLFPTQGCGWLGLAYVGFPHQAFINGTGAFTTQVIGHEMGHNFGLYHAGSLSCGSAAVGGSCNVAEYGDPWDTMGNQRAMHFNAAQKSLLGWIPASSVKTHASGSASYTLSPLEQSGAAVYAVKIPTSNANRTYWLEFRQPIGFDAPLASYPNNGAQIRVARPFEWSAGSDDTEIVDMTPGSGGGFTDSALVAGQSFLDSATGINIIVTSATASALTVSVSKSGSTAVATTLASSANPSTVGASVTLTATVTGTSPTGTVNFKDGSLSISGCSAVALSGSGNTRTAACVTSSLAIGTHSIVAAYSGDSTNAASSSNVLAQTVNKVGTTTGIASSLNPSTAGTSVTFTATVTGSSPTGTVNFTDGGSSISGCSAASLAGSGNIRTAACSTRALAAGTHWLGAVCGGDASNNGSSSVALSQSVNPSGSSSTTTTFVNASFETPALSSGGYQYNPSGAGIGWTFSSNSGIESNGSAWGAALAPDGKQAAFLQSLGTISQTVSLNAGSYTLSFQAARRNCCVSPYVQPVKVTVDGVQIGSLVSPASTSFSLVSIAFTVGSSGAHTIVFAGTDGTDKTTFIDAVTIQ
jgi:predicted Zn-dependent protease